MTTPKEHPERIPGVWWISDDPDNTVPGDLLPDDRKLELNGSFEGIRSGIFGIGKPGLIHARDDRTIQGVARNGGRLFTLEYFDDPAFSIATPGYRADTYTLGKIFEGNHFDRVDNLAFERYYVEFPYLLEWVNDGVISMQMTFPKDQALMAKDTSFKIEIGGLKTIEVYKGTNFTMSFTIHPEGIRMGAPVRMNLSERCIVKIESVGTNLPFEGAGAIIAHMERFLAIATGQSINPLKYQASSGNGHDSRTVTILIPPLGKARRHKDISLHDMNFSFADIRTDSQTIFDQWFKDMRKHADMFDLFSIIRSDLPKNINNQFKDIVSAVEGYVSVEEGKLDVSPDKALKTLNEKLPKEDRPMVSADYHKIRITRNKLAHLAVPTKYETAILNNADKWLNLQRMTFLLEYSLLKGLGLSEAMLKQFYEKRKLHI